MPALAATRVEVRPALAGMSRPRGRWPPHGWRPPLALGEGARLWLSEAAAAGTSRIRMKMAQAVQLAKLFDASLIDWALGHAAVHGRFAEADLPSILDHHHDHHAHGGTSHTGQHRASEDASLTQGTDGWARLGTSQDDIEGEVNR